MRWFEKLVGVQIFCHTLYALLCTPPNISSHMDIRLLNTNGRLNRVNLKLPNSRSKPKMDHHQNLQPQPIPPLWLPWEDDDSESWQQRTELASLHDQANTLIFYSFSQTHMRLFLSNKIQIHWTDLDSGFWGLLCFLPIILMYKRENLTEGSKDLGEFGFLFCFVFCFLFFVFCFLFIYYLWWVFGQEDNRG